MKNPDHALWGTVALVFEWWRTYDTDGDETNSEDRHKGVVVVPLERTDFALPATTFAIAELNRDRDRLLGYLDVVMQALLPRSCDKIRPLRLCSMVGYSVTAMQRLIETSETMLVVWETICTFDEEGNPIFSASQ